MMRNIRIIVLAVFIVFSLIAIAPNPDPKGFIVTHVFENYSSFGITNGEIVYKINDVEATEQFMLASYSGIVKIDTNKGSKIGRANGTLGLEFEKVPHSNIKFGLDIKGGVHAIVEPNTTDPAEVEQIVSTLETRINVFGLRESVFRTIKAENEIFIEVSIAGGSRQELQELLETEGKFEAKIPLILKKGTISLDKEYQLIKNNDSIKIDGKSVRIGESFILSEIDFALNGFSGDAVNVTALVFSSKDIKTVYFDPQRSTMQPSDDGYRWSFGVQLSPEGASKFSYVTKNLGVVPGGYLDSQIYLYLDNELIDSLNIDASLKGRVQTEISVSGSSPDFQQAVNARSKLQSILRSGALPASINVVQLDTVSPSLGSDFIASTMLAAVVAIIGVVLVVTIRYRKIKLVLPMVFISLSEVLIILGVATSIGWTIDIAAIAGIIAAIGTGIDSQIIILDQAIHGESEERSLKQKMAKAFFIIFGSGGTVIGAMLPLFVVGFGTLRGFALVTIIGVLVGILITRPAYGVVVEKLYGKNA